MDIFKNYKDEICILSDEQEKHIFERHPGTNKEHIGKCLLDPMEVRQSSSNEISQLYYITKTKDRLFCVVVKVCNDGNYISTAYTTSKIKSGKIIYSKEK
jgi:hypothetical protein